MEPVQTVLVLALTTLILLALLPPTSPARKAKPAVEKLDNRRG